MLELKECFGLCSAKNEECVGECKDVVSCSNASKERNSCIVITGEMHEFLTKLEGNYYDRATSQIFDHYEFSKIAVLLGDEKLDPEFVSYLASHKFICTNGNAQYRLNSKLPKHRVIFGERFKEILNATEGWDLVHKTMKVIHQCNQAIELIGGIDEN